MATLNGITNIKAIVPGKNFFYVLKLNRILGKEAPPIQPGSSKAFWFELGWDFVNLRNLKV